MNFYSNKHSTHVLTKLTHLLEERRKFYLRGQHPPAGEYSAALDVELFGKQLFGGPDRVGGVDNDNIEGGAVGGLDEFRSIRDVELQSFIIKSTGHRGEIFLGGPEK